jgi:hypothetical protein
LAYQLMRWAAEAALERLSATRLQLAAIWAGELQLNNGPA